MGGTPSVRSIFLPLGLLQGLPVPWPTPTQPPGPRHSKAGGGRHKGLWGLAGTPGSWGLQSSPRNSCAIITDGGT